MTTPLLSRNVSGDQYNWALSSAYYEGVRVFDPSPALLNDPDIYTKIRFEPVMGGAIDQRLHMVAARTWHLQAASSDPVDTAYAKLLENLVRETPRFTESRRLLAEAFLTGAKYAAITGGFQTKRLASDTVARRWFIPGRLVDMGRQRFRAIAHRDKEGGVTVSWEIWHVGAREWVAWTNTDQYVKHLVVRSEDSLGHGKGLADSLHDLLYAKMTVLRLGLQGVERWAKGVVVAKVDGGREAGTGNPNRTLLANWLAALRKMTSDGYYVFDKDDAIEVLGGPETGHQMVEAWIERLDNTAVVRILGASLPSQKSEGGSFALGKVQADTRESIIQGDQELEDDTLTVDYVGYLAKVNRPVFAEMGLGEARLPRFETINEPVKDPTQRSTVIKTLLDAGVPLKSKEVYSDTGFTEPADGDKVIEGRPEPPPFGMPGMGGAPPGGVPPPGGAAPAGGQPPAPKPAELPDLMKTLRMFHAEKEPSARFSADQRAELAEVIQAALAASKEVPAPPPPPAPAPPPEAPTIPVFFTAADADRWFEEHAAAMDPDGWEIRDLARRVKARTRRG